MSSENGVQNASSPVASPAARSVASPAPVGDSATATPDQPVLTFLNPETVLINSRVEVQFTNSSTRNYAATCVKQEDFVPTPDGRDKLVALLEAYRKWLKEHISTMQEANILLADIPFDLDLDALKMIHDGSLKGRVHGVNLVEPTLTEGLEKFTLAQPRYAPPVRKAVCNRDPRIAAKEAVEVAAQKVLEEVAKGNTKNAAKENTKEAAKKNTEETAKESLSGDAPEASSETPDVAPETADAAPEAAPESAPEPPQDTRLSVDAVDMGIRVLYYPWRGVSYRDVREVVFAADLRECLNHPGARALAHFCLDLPKLQPRPGQSWPSVIAHAFAPSAKQAEEGTRALFRSREAWKAWGPWIKLFQQANTTPDWTLYPHAINTHACQNCTRMCGCGCRDDPVDNLVLHLKEVTNIHIRSYQAQLVSAIKVLLQYAISLPTPYLLKSTINFHRANATKAALEALAALSVCIDRVVNPVEAIEFCNHVCDCQDSDDDDDGEDDENEPTNKDDVKKDAKGEKKEDVEEAVKETAKEAAEE